MRRSLGCILWFATLGFFWMALPLCTAGARAAPQQNGATSEPPQVVQLFARGGQLIQAKDFRGAAQVYEQILTIQPHSFPALNNLGVIYAHLGEYTQAASAYERALRIEPGSFPLWVNLGLAYFKAREFEKAIKPLARAVAIRRDNFQAEALLGMSYYWAGDFTSASAELEKAIAAAPGNRALQYLLCESYLKAGQDQKLLVFTGQAGSLQPLTAHLLRGEADDDLNRIPAAIQEFKAAAALAPDGAGIHFGLGFLYWESHDNRSAEAEFRREMEVGGLTPQSEAYLGDIALKEGEVTRARALLRQSLSLLPKTGLAFYDAGVIDARAKNDHSAERELKDALRLGPGQRDAYIALASVYRDQGEYDLAVKALKLAAGIPVRRRTKLSEIISTAPPAAN
ncbi:MAG: tetratricopeptide repeat protein [Terriglobia bacterium]